MIRHRVLYIAFALNLAATGWATELPTDPALKTGQLENGLKWIYREHGTPEDRMSIYLHVPSGSLNETEDQRGLAHFLEHMVFNGSENFPPGKLIETLEQIGVEFGADLNAFVGFDQTGYTIDLPDAKLETIDLALKVLSDQAFGALLLDEEIEKERGVILSEKRSGMSAQQRMLDAVLEEMFSGTRFSERLPIGLESVIREAGRDRFEDYYRTWYRPETMTLIAVGDRPASEVLPLIENYFGAYRAPVPAREPAESGLGPNERLRAGVFSDPDFAAASVQFWTVVGEAKPVTTRAQSRVELVENIAQWIVNKRLSDRQRAGDAAYTSAGMSIQPLLRDAKMLSTGIQGEPGEWRLLIEQVVEELGRAKAHGFLDRELDLARREILSSAERATRTEPTVNGTTLARRYLATVNAQEPIMSARQRYELISELLPTIKLDEVSGALRQLLVSPGNVILMMPQRSDVVLPSKNEVLAVTLAAWNRDLPQIAEREAAEGLLARALVPGTVVETSSNDAFRITHAWLSNGVRVHYRFMDQKEDRVTVGISLAGGQIEETAENAGISAAAALIFSQPATQRLSSTEVSELMTGKNINVGGGASDDRFSIVVSGDPADLESGLELVHALLTEGKLEASALRTWQEATVNQLAAAEKLPQFPALRRAAELMTGNDPRRTIPTVERVESQTREASQRWFDRIASQAPIEVAVVGDIDQTRAMELVTKYLGSLPARPRTTTHLDPLRETRRSPGPLTDTVRFDSFTPQAMVVSGFISANAFDVDATRHMSLARSTVQSRLIKELREDEGLIYSGGVQAAPDYAYRDSSFFAAFAPCAPGASEEVRDRLLRIKAEFAKTGPTAEELDAAKEQVITNLEQQLEEPGFWRSRLQRHDLHRVNLAKLETIIEDYQGYTAGAVRETFAAHYTPERTVWVIAQPNTGDESAGASSSMDQAGLANR